MVVDLNFHKVTKYFLSIFFFLLFSSKSFSENFTFKKLADFSDPWGSSFINNEELIITEKTGKIKIVNIISEEVYEVEHNLNYFVHGQGGLLDIIYKDNYLWISYSENRGDWKTSTSIAKAKLNKKNLDFKNIFSKNNHPRPFFFCENRDFSSSRPQQMYLRNNEPRPFFFSENRD